MLTFRLPALRACLDVLISRVLSPAGVVLSGVFLSLCVCGFGTWSLYQEKQDARARAVQNARNVLLLVERDITRTIELYDLSLQTAAEGVNDPAVVRLPQLMRDSVLFDRVTFARNLDGMVVLDEHGKVQIDSRKTCAVGSDLSDREFFAMHRDHPDLGLYLSKPYFPPCATARPVISLSRRITRADGSFGGVVSGALAIDYFRELLGGIEVGPKGTAAVIETNGTLVARLPFNPKVIGRDLSRVDVFRKVLVAMEGTFVGNASIDGMRKVYVYRRLTNFPIVVDVAPAEADIYAEWHRRAVYVVSLMLVFSAVAVMSSLLLARELTRRADAELLLKEVARVDSLTGLDNRRTFDQFIQRESRRALRTASALSLLFVDIDKFKSFNDRHGHCVGDEVLKTVAQSIRECVRRPADAVARYGGEEFVVTLPDTSAAAARLLAERIRQAVSAVTISKGNAEHNVTVSIGVATWTPQAGFGPESLVDLADKALYEAKTIGRDCVREAMAEGYSAETSV